MFLTNNDQLTHPTNNHHRNINEWPQYNSDSNNHKNCRRETQNHQIKKSNLSNRDLNLFNEDISWASIDDDLLNTSWDMLLTVVKTDEMYKIIINICLDICKNHFCQRKVQENSKYPEIEWFWWEKDQNC